MKYCVLIDDDVDDRDIFSIAIDELTEKIEFRSFEGGDIALRSLKETNARIPDLIFLDLNMPRMNGKECLALLKSDDKLKVCDVIIYSTSKSPEDKKMAQDLGAKDYIVKPGSITELVTIIESQLINCFTE